MNYLYVAIGSAVGGLARFALGGWLQRQAGSAFPVGTLIVNVTGSFVLGAILVVVARQQGPQADATRLLLAVGLCGGYTTFSTFSAETVGLIESGASGMAALNVALSVGLALISTIAGASLTRMMLGRVS